MATQEDLILRSQQSGRLEGRTGSPPAAGTAGRRVCVGVVAGAHGVRGALRIKSYTAEPADVARYGSLADEAGRREFKPRLIGVAKGVVLVKFAGVVDRDAAEALRGCRLYLPREALPPPDDEEYYHADLIGLDALLGDGTRLGRVQAVHDFGAGDCLEIVRSAGPPAMVPFTRAVVPVVDLENGRLVIDPPPGLLESVPRGEERGEAEAAAREPVEDMP
jgi:16S rRNA processing protein RimM